jgi:hypothetical protein
MANILDSFKHFTKETHPKTVEFLSRPSAQGIPRQASIAVDAAKEANKAAREFANSYIKSLPAAERAGAKAPPIEGIASEFLNNSSSQEKGIYKNNTADFSTELERMMSHIHGAIDEISKDDAIDDSSKDALRGQLNEALRQVEAAEEARGSVEQNLTNLKNIITEEEAKKIRGYDDDASQLEAFANTNFEDWYNSAASLYKGEYRNPARFAEDRAKAEAAGFADAETSRIATILDPNENYLNHSFREQ